MERQSFITILPFLDRDMLSWWLWSLWWMIHIGQKNSTRKDDPAEERKNKFFLLLIYLFIAIKTWNFNHQNGGYFKYNNINLSNFILKMIKLIKKNILQKIKMQKIEFKKGVYLGHFGDDNRSIIENRGAIAIFQCSFLWKESLMAQLLSWIFPLI